MAANLPQTTTIDSKEYRQVREGLASILAPYRQESSAKAKKSHNNDEGSQSVFYNPIQQFNRDLSVLAILTYGEGAIVEKIARFSKKTKGWKGKAQRKANLRNGSDVAPQYSRKRKADEIEEGQNSKITSHGSKKPRANEFEANEDELEVLQLSGSAVERGNQGVNQAENTVNGEDTTQQVRELPFTILDALSASGIRAMRYAKEIPFATNIIANDLSAEAVKSIELNIEHNEVKDTVHSNVGDARAYMYSKLGNEARSSSYKYIHRFDVIDLDPYGTATPFIDSAVQALQDGGLLCVTCTDAGVWASNGYPEKAYALYGGLPVKGAHSHEAGLRLILNSIATTAAKYGLAIEPLLSLSIDFYGRLFIRVHKSPQSVKVLAGTSMLVYSCDNGCGSWATQPLARNQEREDRAGNTFYKHSFAQAPNSPQNCEHCKRRMHLGGPLWAGPLHNPYFIQRILDRLDGLDHITYGTLDRVRGMLTVALEEDLTLSTSNVPLQTAAAIQPTAPNDKIIPRLPPSLIDSTPLFFIPNYFSKILHCLVPSEDQIRGAIRHLGYKVTRSHCKAGSIKTNAPFSVIWEIMREWIRQKAPIKEGAIKPETPGYEIVKNSRGSETARAKTVGKSVLEALDKAQNLEDVKCALRAGLWMTDHEKEPATQEAADPETITNGNDESDSPNIDVEAPVTAQLDTPVHKLKIVFDENLGKEKPRGKLVRYQINPRANWGPMNRASGS